MDQDKKIAEIKSNFNDENAWDNRTDLFNIYFSDTIEANKHYMVYLDSKELSFDKAVDDLKYRYKRASS